MTYTLLPGPVPTHKVVVLPFSTLKVFVWCIVKTQGELGVCEDMVKFSGITIPDLAFGSHPLQYRTINLTALDSVLRSKDSSEVLRFQLERVLS